MVAAGDALCASEEEAIPELITLLKMERTILPTSRPWAIGSYMYPGHGGSGACFPFVFYELNESQVRAGWLLERITFQDFGFVSEWEGDPARPSWWR